MWDPPRPGPEPVSPALAGRLSTTAPPGKPYKLIFKMPKTRHSPVVQWLRLGALTTMGPDSIPGWGIKIPQAAQCSQKKKKKSLKPKASFPLQSGKFHLLNCTICWHIHIVIKNPPTPTFGKTFSKHWEKPRRFQYLSCIKQNALIQWPGSFPNLWAWQPKLEQ